MMEGERGGIEGFMKKLQSYPDKYASDIVVAVHTAIAEYECDSL